MTTAKEIKILIANLERAKILAKSSAQLSTVVSLIEQAITSAQEALSKLESNDSFNVDSRRESPSRN